MISIIGVIGTGNMGSAVLRGIIDAEYVKQSQIIAYDASARRLRELGSDLPGIKLAVDCLEVAEKADLIILAVKPNYIQEVIDEIRPVLDGKAVLSIAAGWTTGMLSRALQGTTATYMRVMPNTPALVGEGMTALCDETTFTEENFAFAKGIFESVGKTKVLPERLFDGVTAISGSSPAYVYMMIEAMADAGVREGLPRTYAYEMAAQSVLGSALMVLSSGTHPAALKDAVCSPGGTTIEAVRILEKNGFRSSIIEAMDACARKSREMALAKGEKS
ncbi:MAG: pyrroline-5-carboxylate reductase [Clostridiales bacterium]|nr:pyrroline-5-carboxylate reductase [Clostridiales bacterium]